MTISAALITVPEYWPASLTVIFVLARIASRSLSSLSMVNSPSASFW